MVTRVKVARIKEETAATTKAEAVAKTTTRVEAAVAKATATAREDREVKVVKVDKVGTMT